MKFKKVIVAFMTALTLFGTMDFAQVANLDAHAKTTKTTKKTTKKATTKKKAKLSKSELKAKEWIAYRESRGSYRARNGRYIGRYQLTASYLKGDYSKANQEKTADRYVKNRYGSWNNAKRHWQRYGWY